MSVRVYVAATLPALAEYDGAGAIPESADRVAIPADVEDEESEYLALMSAADLSAELLGGPGRRVVIVAEVPPADADGEIPMAKVVAVHADLEPFTDPDDDLGWFATQEIADLVRQQ